ncbi:MAG TPA: hypothetical protein PKO12_00545, partial [Holophaga sp.]|nr:hypothetical protein [Holophaga sp.]
MPPLESDPESPQPGPTGQGLSAPQAPERAPARNVFDPFRELLDMIKFEHTVFALPFAFLGALAASPVLPSW